MSAAAPPIINDSGELTPWAETIAEHYASALLAKNAGEVRRLDALVAGPDFRALRELCADMRASRGLAEAFSRWP